MQQVTPNRMSEVADIVTLIGFFVSIASLILTIYVLTTIKGIRRHFVSRIRLPELGKQLKRFASQLADYQNEYETSKPDIKLLIGRVEVTLAEIHTKVSGPTKDLVMSGIDKIQEYNQKDEGSLEDSWAIYGEVQKIIDKIDFFQEDQKWES